VRGASYPLVTVSSYSKGTFYLVAIPDTFRDLYSLPASVLNSIRNFMAGDMFVRLQGPAQVGLFAYDNNKFIVESFQETPVPTARVITDKRITKLRDMLTGETLTGSAQGPNTVFETALKHGSYRVFAAE